MLIDSHLLKQTDLRLLRQTGSSSLRLIGWHSMKRTDSNLPMLIGSNWLRRIDSS